MRSNITVNSLPHCFANCGAGTILYYAKGEANMLGMEREHDLVARVKVIGVGGGGGNAINRMIKDNLENVEFISANTDSAALNLSQATYRLQLGEDTTRGLGAGANPEIGRKAAEESRQSLMNVLEGTDILFITAGMGGGTGTGAAPVIAGIAKEQGILTVAVVTTPFVFEGTRRMQSALEGIKGLKANADTIIIVPNQNLLKTATKDTTMAQAFEMSDSILRQGLRGILDVIFHDGSINLDFADVKAIMENAGVAHLGTGSARGGENKLEQAVDAALNSPLLETKIDGARSMLIQITSASKEQRITDVAVATEKVMSACSPGVNLIFGITADESLEDTMLVTIIATGLEGESVAEPEPVVVLPHMRTQAPQEPVYVQAPASYQQAPQVQQAPPQHQVQQTHEVHTMPGDEPPVIGEAIHTPGPAPTHVQQAPAQPVPAQPVQPEKSPKEEIKALPEFTLKEIMPRPTFLK